jgi:hypothetical protein
MLSAPRPSFAERAAWLSAGGAIVESSGGLGSTAWAVSSLVGTVTDIALF